MKTAELIEHLLKTPPLLATAEEEVLGATRRLTAAREDLADREAGLILAGLPGKNAEERAAHLRTVTQEWREAVQAAEDEVKQAGIQLRVVQETSRVLRAVSRLIGWDEEEED